MYCPRCGKQFEAETGYCRTCGLSLTPVQKIVSGDADNAPVVTSRPNVKTMRIGLGLFILGLAIGLINAAIRDIGLFPDSYGKMVFLILVASGMLTMASGFIFPSKKYSKRKAETSTSESDHPEHIDIGSMTARLLPENESLDNFGPQRDRQPEMIARGSITEHTTRNLG